jgi:hypothetical protein
MIDYDQSWYTAEFHSGSDKHIERKVDKYLAYLSYLCYLIETDSVTKKEIQLFEYELIRTMRSISVQAYLWNLVHFSRRFGIECSCRNLVDYGIRRNVIDKDFLTNNENKFPKYLDF